MAGARGSAPRGILRLSGPTSIEVASRCLASPIGEGTYVLLEASFVLPDTGPFPVIVYVMRAPHSYTRQDVVEIHAPGSPPLLSAMLDALSRAGARPALPGEFTKRAFLSGRIDLSQAEAVLALVKARSEGEQRLAFSALRGNLRDGVAAVRGRLVTLAADVEAGLDFFEEDATFAPPDRQAREISRALEEVRGLVDSSVTRQVFSEEAVAVIFGPANAGKSTLFNAICGAEHAIVHETPGTTRDLLEALIVIDGIRLVLADTAGVRRPAEVVEEIAIERTKHSVRTAQAVVFVVDASAAVTPETESLYREAAVLPHIVVLNKSDMGLAVTREIWRRRFGGEFVVETCAASGQGCEELKKTLAAVVSGSNVDLSGAKFFLAGRQRRCLDEAMESLARAAIAVSSSQGDEVVSLEVKEAIESLGRITGDDYVEDLLDEVFSRFCLGK